MVAVAIVGAGVAGAVGSVAAGSIASSGAQKAAGTMANAQLEAMQIQQQEGQQAAQLQVPYENLGTQTAGQLGNELAAGTLGAPAPLDQASIQNMPGYQFALQQGLLSTQNAQAAQGLGVSGNALAAASQYATGLANTNFQNYFSDYWANQNNRYNMLYNTTQLGQNAATNAGNQMVQVGGQIGNTLTTSAANIGSAQATAAADTAQGVSGLGSGVSNALLANALLGQTQGGSTVAANTQNALNAGGSPAAFQGAWGTSPGTYVP